MGQDVHINPSGREGHKVSLWPKNVLVNIYHVHPSFSVSWLCTEPWLVLYRVQIIILNKVTDVCWRQLEGYFQLLQCCSLCSTQAQYMRCFANSTERCLLISSCSTSLNMPIFSQAQHQENPVSICCSSLDMAGSAEIKEILKLAMKGRRRGKKPTSEVMG